MRQVLPPICPFLVAYRSVIPCGNPYGLWRRYLSGFSTRVGCIPYPCSRYWCLKSVCLDMTNWLLLLFGFFLRFSSAPAAANIGFTRDIGNWDVVRWGSKHIKFFDPKPADLAKISSPRENPGLIEREIEISGELSPFLPIGLLLSLVSSESVRIYTFHLLMTGFSVWLRRDHRRVWDRSLDIIANRFRSCGPASGGCGWIILWKPRKIYSFLVLLRG